MVMRFKGGFDCCPFLDRSSFVVYSLFVVDSKCASCEDAGGHRGSKTP